MSDSVTAPGFVVATTKLGSFAFPCLAFSDLVMQTVPAQTVSR
jgi:hypothetical protein